MDLALHKDIVGLVGVIGTLLAAVWHIRGQAAKVTIAVAKVQSTVDSIDQRLDKEERKSSAAHRRLDEMNEKLTRLEVVVEQMTDGGGA